MLKKFMSFVCVGLISVAFVGCAAETASTTDTTTAEDSGMPAEDATTEEGAAETPAEAP